MVKKERQRRRLRLGEAKPKQTVWAENALNRSLLLFCSFLLCFVLVGGNLVWMGLVPQDEPEQRFARVVTEAPVRGDIYDRNGVLLATTLKVKSVYADPKMMLNADEALFKLATVIPTLNFEDVAPKLHNKNRRFVWLKRKLSPAQVKDVNDLGIPGVYFREELARIYPHKNLASHVLGGVGVDGHGLAGVEASYDEQLQNGEDVHLTLDIRLQGQLRTQLLKNMERTSAKGSWGVVSDPNTAEILAMTSLPDYDPNHYAEADRETWFNKTVYGAYEMGSTFKIFTIAQGLDEGYVHEETPLDITRPLRVGRFTINDSHPQYRIMTMKEAFRRSSNIGTARIADMFAEGAQESFFRKLGLLNSLDVGLKEVGSPIYQNRWGRIQTMTRAFGHGLAVTPVQMVGAVGAIVSDGTYKAPHIVKGFHKEEPREVIALHTVESMRELMQDAVENGTGRRAKMEGYAIGGKTGTAEKAEAGGYSRSRHLASFVGVVPAYKPELLTLVMVDEPQGAENQGGSAAAPAFKAFVNAAAPMVGLRPEFNPFDMKNFETKRLAWNETFNAITIQHQR